jgi:phosphohistidine phosphatase
MKRLMLLRHFKSSWAEAGLADRDRALAPRGQRDAVAMAETMIARDLAPDRILCSPARRTRETLAQMQEYLHCDCPIDFLEELYSGSETGYRGIIAARGGDADRLMVIGHNPRIHVTAVELIGSGRRADQENLAAKYPTGALAVIEFDIDGWHAITEDSGQLTAFIRPRDAEDHEL